MTVSVLTASEPFAVEKAGGSEVGGPSGTGNHLQDRIFNDRK